MHPDFSSPRVRPRLCHSAGSSWATRTAPVRRRGWASTLGVRARGLALPPSLLHDFRSPGHHVFDTDTRTEPQLHAADADEARPRLRDVADTPALEPALQGFGEAQGQGRA